MKIQLLSDRILVKPNAVEERNSFGIILPENQKNRDESVIVAVGPKVKELKVGDTIRKFTQVPGIPYAEDGVDYLILSEGSENPRRADVEFRVSNH